MPDVSVYPHPIAHPFVLGAFILLTACGDSYVPAGGGSSSAGGDSSSAGAGGASSTSATGGTAMLCTPGETEDCYSGPTETQGVGVCEAGSHTCADDGQSWNDCNGEALPAISDDCSTLDDEDCDGFVNEPEDGCICLPGEMQDCYTGPIGTKDIGICVGGVQGCDASGKAWGGCTEEVVPQTENCNLVGDEDCDGIGCSDFVWEKGWQGASTQYARFHDVATDSQGNLFVVGYFWQPIDLGGGTITSAGGWDIFVVKYDKSGAHLWSKRFGDSSHEYAHGVAVDSQGDVIVTGAFEGSSLKIGASTIYRAYSSIDRSGFIAKLSGTSGNTTWSKSRSYEYYNGVQSYFEKGVTVYRVAIGQNDDIYALVRGEKLDKPPLGSDTIFSEGTAGRLELWQSNGTLKQAVLIDGSGIDTMYDIAVDSTGSVIVTGNTSEGISTPLIINDNNSTAGRSAFVAKFNSDLVVQWGSSFGANGSYQYPRSVAVMSNGDVVTSGSYKYGGLKAGNITLGPVLLNNQMYLATLKSSNGSVIWAKDFGDNNDQTYFRVAVDSQDDIVATATVRGSVNFGGGALTGDANQGDLVLAKFDKTGLHTWSHIFADLNIPNGYGSAPLAIATGADDRVHLVGYANKAVFGLGPVNTALGGFIATFEP